ncbi:IS110 family transposase [Dehalococcoidia bacterium]|nr:IS110 family transposase [Dehalococcoidia bacterium]
MSKERYIGVDHHRKQSYISVMDKQGNRIKEGLVANQKDKVATFLSQAQCDGDSAAVLEAGRNWPVMYDWLEELVGEVHLAHPLKVKAIAEAKIKTDKIDARVLAHLLRSDLLPEAHVAGPEIRQVRNVLRQRMFFVRLRTMVKNRISSLLDRYPELTDGKPCKDLFSEKGLRWLKKIEVKEVDRRILDEELELYQALKEHIGKSEHLVEELAKEDLRVKLLKSIPGIGKFFAVLIAYEVDDISRFANEKKFFSYMGIIPSTFSSGGKTFHGKLTKQGNKYLRWAMIEAIWPAIQKDADLRYYYERVRAGKGPNPAKVATARRLATIVYRVLSQNRPYKVSGSRLPSLRHGGPQ